MGGTVSTEENKQWALEKVLFFDPETRPDPDEVLQGRGGAGCVKRFTPSSAKLCNRNFLIRFFIDGKGREFVLKLQNQPHCRLLLCDKSGEPIKEIRTTRIKYIQRQNVRVEVYVKTERNEMSSLSFDFENAKECDLFSEFFKMLFGIQVHHFGFRDMGSGMADLMKNDDGSDDSDWSGTDEDDYERRQKAQAQQRRQRKMALQRRTGCPLHGDKPCACAVERPTITQGDDESSSSEDEVQAAWSSRFPVSIEGVCESGSTVRMKDLTARLVNKAPARVVEWFFSNEPGKDPSFPTVPIKTGLSLRIEERYVGSSIQIRVARRMEGSNLANPFVYSVAVKGPVTVNSVTARLMLEYLAETETPIEVTMTNQSLHTLFDLPPDCVANTRPFFDSTLYLTRLGLAFRANVRDLEDPLERAIPWEFFYVTRPEPDELDYREDDITMIFHILSYSFSVAGFRETTVTIRLPSESIRDAVYHTVVFFRLQRKVTSYERFARDLATGNCTEIKHRYARLWTENSWTSYATLAPSQEALARVAEAAVAAGPYVPRPSAAARLPRTESSNCTPGKPKQKPAQPAARSGKSAAGREEAERKREAPAARAGGKQMPGDSGKAETQAPAKQSAAEAVRARLANKQPKRDYNGFAEVFAETVQTKPPPVKTPTKKAGPQ
ncbi:hypothetical protein TGPRC2_203160 [Toxoplasma gondii TgCatPRC2]|uniref:Uncharacterized protein n=10 Tax=Toxoplasma gondii TaxID=5811 RepID=S7WAS1_TOXGG|nr:hypothetical protein TGGT1_203160 [Toxoplasma gondii GT1]KAF4642856.1 hypothetical protein TGRH88_035850 [Toxoplasma gondii]KFG37760.1 hypothetical protein TGDOM2_203160 [Toxoplasma gondii GAB2-2007-GAL-DOM2]KFH09154.1 hypothetical protein TGMAS_203160 [Toxoplasma gondii MAS]KYF44229.1 hypothetical protein TGARI_203160 [Toxoplasma gondii ARI]KYK63651.1 hypothetical protein TGPRC2_203160 [Toxoplasma gondii TgCatPRC2]RQX73226.1 hypothetical protein TGCAST_203160 [Toxoplasma gondii CAST]